MAATAFNDKLNMHYNFGFHPWTHIDHTSTNEYKFVHTGIDVSKAVALTALTFVFESAPTVAVQG